MYSRHKSCLWVLREVFDYSYETKRSYFIFMYDGVLGGSISLEQVDGMSMFYEFVFAYPNSHIANQYKEFKEDGFANGNHGSFAQALFKGDVWIALKYADKENKQMLHDLLFPGFVEDYHTDQCEACECIHPDDIDPSDYCNEGYQ